MLFYLIICDFVCLLMIIAFCGCSGVTFSKKMQKISLNSCTDENFGVILHRKKQKGDLV